MREILGQKRAKKILENAINTGKIPHFFIFVGPKGVGKVSMAKEFAMALNCQDVNGPCGTCSTCLSIMNNKHPDVTIINDDTISIAQAREMRDIAILSPISGRYRVFIVEDADRLTLPSANSLLKILEEPPPSTIFIFTTRDINNMLKTIISRAMVIPFSPVRRDIIFSVLKEKGCPDKLATEISYLSQGDLEKAIEIFESDSIERRLIPYAEIESLESPDVLLDSLSAWLRDAIIALSGAEERFFILSSTTYYRYKDYPIEDLIDDFFFLEEIKRLEECNGDWKLAFMLLYKKLEVR